MDPPTANQARFSVVNLARHESPSPVKIDMAASSAGPVGRSDDRIPWPYPPDLQARLVRQLIIPSHPDKHCLGFKGTDLLGSMHFFWQHRYNRTVALRRQDQKVASPHGMLLGQDPYAQATPA